MSKGRNLLLTLFCCCCSSTLNPWHHPNLPRGPFDFFQSMLFDRMRFCERPCVSKSVSSSFFQTLNEKAKHFRDNQQVDYFATKTPIQEEIPDEVWTEELKLMAEARQRAREKAADLKWEKGAKSDEYKQEMQKVVKLSEEITEQSADNLFVNVKGMKRLYPMEGAPSSKSGDFDRIYMDAK